MKIEIKYGGIVTTSTCSFYDAHLLLIDEKEKTIDVSGDTGFMIGMIHYENEDEVLFMPYGIDDRLIGNTIDVVKNGQLIYKEE